jgi:hypothetical protein
VAAASGIVAAASASLLYCLTAVAQVNVPTYHNDNSRTGQNTAETILTTANVNSSQFGKLFTVKVDGPVYAQPLYMSNVNIDGGVHNVVYVATQNDSIYAIDAESGAIYWKASLLPSGGSPISSADDIGCGDIPGTVGITGTPVIDPTTGAIYAVAKSKVNGVIYQYLHALDLGAGSEKFGGPTEIQATYPGTATDGNGSTMTFSARHENQRAALLLDNGQIWISWASHCDVSPWHGWIMAYSATTLAQLAVYNDTPNGNAGGIWMSGSGPAADASGNVYVSSGNGAWSTTDLGDSIIKLGAPAKSSIPVLDSFTPYNQATLSSSDTDLSSGGLVLLPPLANGTQMLATMGKNGHLYLVNTNDLGGYCLVASPACTDSDPNIVEEITDAMTGYWGVPAYWNGHLYFGGGNDYTGKAEPLKAFSFNANNTGLVSTTPTSESAASFHFSGPNPSVSSNGTTNGIVWAMDNSQWKSTCTTAANCQILYAYDATNLANMLYNSNQAANNRDLPGTAVKFTTPTIANGRVYVGSAGTVEGYGLLSGYLPTAAAPQISPAGGSFTTSEAVTISDSTPGATIYYTVNGATPTTASTRYTGALTVTANTTVNAIAAAAGYESSPVSTASYTLTSPPAGGANGPVNLASSFNVDGIVATGSKPAAGGLDTYGYAFSETLLGSQVTWDGITFDLGSAGVADVVSGGTVALPAGSYSTLHLLATAVNGNHPNETFTVTYTDGSTSTFTQSLSDWYTPQDYPGEAVAVTMAYRITPSGTTDNRTFHLYGYSFAINAAKTVKSVTLPAVRNVVVLAATLSGAAAGAGAPSAPTPVALKSGATVYGLFDEGSEVTNGGLDGHDFAYAAGLLGSSVSWSGTTFTLGAAAAADIDSGVTIALPAGKFSQVELLATGVNGNQVKQGFTVTYTDGTSTLSYQSLSDWYTPQTYAGESEAVTLPYRLTATGATDNRTFHLYGYSIAINNAKSVKSLTLPANRNVVVLAVTLVP